MAQIDEQLEKLAQRCEAAKRVWDALPRPARWILSAWIVLLGGLTLLPVVILYEHLGVPPVWKFLPWDGALTEAHRLTRAFRGPSG